MEADQLGRLRDILDSARLIATYVKDATETAFRADTEKQDAVVQPPCAATASGRMKSVRRATRSGDVP